MELFDAIVETFSLDSIVAAAANYLARRERDVGKFEDAIEATGRPRRQTIVPFLVRRVVTQAILRRSLPDQAAKSITLKWLVRAQEAMSDAMNWADRDRAEEPRYAESLALRVFDDQGWDQRSLELYSLDLLLTRRTIERCLREGLDLDNAYLRTFGISHRDLMLGCIGIWAYLIGDSTDNALLDPTSWDRSAVMGMSRRAIDRFFSLCARDYAGLQSVGAVGPEGFEPYWLSPLTLYPIALLDSGAAAAPVPRDVLERPLRSFYIDLLGALSAEDRTLHNRASSEVYEDYVAAMIEPAEKVISLHRPATWTAGANCDFVAEERRVCTLVEVKNVHFSLNANISKDPRLLKTEIRKRGIAKAVHQLQETSELIAAGDTPIKKHIRQVGLIVIRGHQVHLNLPAFRSLIEEVLVEDGSSVPSIEYHLTNDEGFIQLSRLLASGESLGWFLREKNGRASSADMEDAVWYRRSKKLAQHPLREEFTEAFRGLLPPEPSGSSAQSGGPELNPRPA